MSQREPPIEATRVGTAEQLMTALRKIWESDAPLPTLADFEPPPELLLVASTFTNNFNSRK